MRSGQPEPLALSIEQFANVRAELDSGEPYVEVLARHGLEHDAWRANEESLLGALDADVESGVLDRVRAYRRAYEAAFTSSVPAADAPRASERVLDAAPVAVSPAQPASTRRELASFQRAKAPSTPDALAAAPSRPALPFPVAPASPQIAHAPWPSATPRVPSGTGEFDVRVLQQQAMPFGVPTGTMMSSGAGDAVRPATPFAPVVVAPAPTARPPETRGEGVAPAPTVRPGIDVTLAPSRGAGSGAALPFQGSDIAALERYAEITAALRRDGATEPTLARYGLDLPTWQATVQTFAQRFALSPSLLKAFETMVGRHAHARR